MARGVNKVILIGNLGDEPLCRTTHSGSNVTNISMVTNEVRRNMETGESTEYAEWHRVVMWGKLADIAKQYLHKGSQVYIEGKLRTRSFMDKQGQKKSVTEIVADEMQMLGGKPQGAPSSNGSFAAQKPQTPRSNPQMGNSYGDNNYGGNSNSYAAQAPQYQAERQPSYNNQQNFNNNGNYQQPSYAQEAAAPQPMMNDMAEPASTTSIDEDIPF